MKKTFLLAGLLICTLRLFATTHEIEVANFQFSPSSLNVNVGDTIKWVWKSGTHTATSRTIPAGAATWDEPITAGATSFAYKITVAGTYNYVCVPHEDFGMIASITASAVLPVVMSNFEIMPAKKQTVQLLWSTATEQNTDHFDIMRSTNGTKFYKIGSVPAKGNSSVVTNYTYSDNALPNSTYVYYYLSIVDRDGKTALSSIKSFRNNNSTQKLIVSISPNPISRPGHLMLQFNSDKENTMHVLLFDVAGKLVKQADMAAIAGVNNGHFHIGEVPPGNYTVVFILDRTRESYKIVVQ